MLKQEKTLQGRQVQDAYMLKVDELVSDVDQLAVACCELCAERERIYAVCMLSTSTCILDETC